MLSASELSSCCKLVEDACEVTARRKSLSDAFALGFRFCAFCAGLDLALPVIGALFGVAIFRLDFLRFGSSWLVPPLPPISASLLVSFGDGAAELGAVVG